MWLEGTTEIKMEQELETEDQLKWRLAHGIPYSGKKKTFANFVDLCSATKVFSANFGGVASGRKFWRMCTLGVIFCSIHPHVLAQVLSDKLITTKIWWSPFDGCSFFEYCSYQQTSLRRHLDTDTQALYVNGHTHANWIDCSMNSRNLHSLPICESFLPRKFPTIRYVVLT